MPINVQTHETIMTVTPTYAHNKHHDLVHVETFFRTTASIAEDEVFYVPGKEEVPSHILEILELGGFTFEPIVASEVTSQVSNFADVIAKGTKEEALADAMIGLGSKYLNAVKLKSIGEGTNFYHLSYDYALIPETDGSFVIQTTLPHKGFNMPTGGQVRFVVVLPAGAKCDRAATKGEVPGTTQILEEPTPANVANGREVVSFFYQNDPKFTVKYKY
ncbi:hypothetical protein KO561_12945 [Radiobacillus kanasensis]|uniref:hypothetical protein n=1 Tax=Radiobacillus kanasensis TaxID=2844358 RepID=UPI001E2B1CE5|nr:hypothetical protein [Radiobacillus kanasensis]UFT98109.1 hypothetical protein KO561_12945 [Radiobacillus kanasensis]